MAYALHRRDSQVVTASGLDVLAGLWLLISPFVLAFVPSNATTNNVIFGIIIGVLALIRFMGAYRASSLSWINAILGVWVLISPWVLGFARFRTPTMNNVVTGIIVILLACWSALATDAAATSDVQSTDRGDYTGL